jgi:hypothetical protein
VSAAVKLSAALPGDPDTNGVDDIAADLVKDPEAIRIGVVWFDVAKVTIDTDSHTHIPTIRVRRIEPVGDVTTVPDELRRIVDVALEQRTGRTPLPFDTVDGIQVIDNQE